MSSLKIFRLSTGEDVIGVKQNTSNTDSVDIKNPFIIIPMQSNPGGPVSLALTPYIPYADDDIVSIKRNNVIAEVNPKIEISNSYNQHLGTGIVQFPKPKLIVD
jgi:hypothetical protein